MPTNIDLLPLLQVTVETRSNESWSDSFLFVGAGQAAGYASQGNRGNGTIGAVTTTSGGAVGEHTVRITAPDEGGPAFILSNPDDVPLGLGIVGTQFQAGGLTFTLSAGSIPFQVGDSFTIVVFGAPLNLTGIGFALMSRAGVDTANVTLQADTAEGALLGGGSNGDIIVNAAAGIVGVSFSPEIMRRVPAGTYQFDLLAVADNRQRRCVEGVQVHSLGVTQIAD